jgi:hypothetical protein
MDNVIETAKSARASCRTCRAKIEKGALRFGEAVENQFSPDGGLALRWHHLACAAKSIPAKVKPVLDVYAGEIGDRAEIEAMLAAGGKASAERAFPYAERAPSGRSRCLQCGEAIAKDEWRVAIEREIDTGAFTRSGAGYLHPRCVDAHAGDIWEVVKENSGLDDAEIEKMRARE